MTEAGGRFGKLKSKPGHLVEVPRFFILSAQLLGSGSSLLSGLLVSLLGNVLLVHLLSSRLGSGSGSVSGEASSGGQTKGSSQSDQSDLFHNNSPKQSTLLNSEVPSQIGLFTVQIMAEHRLVVCWWNVSLCNGMCMTFG
jgi:hypothetical protein